jgi:hypothetical protein
MLNNKILWGLFLFIFLFFGVVLSNLMDHMEIGSRMPIAVVDEDLTDLSNEVVHNIKNQESLYVMVVEIDEAQQLLRDGKVEAIYIIPIGFGEKVENLELNELIQVYHLQGSHAGKVISDVFAGEMLESISLFKTMQLFEKTIERYSNLNKDELINEMKDRSVIMNEHISNPIMDIQMMDVEAYIEIPTVDNAIIYQQVIIGMIATFLGFFLLFATTSLIKDKELGIDQRLKSIESSRWLYFAGNIMSLLIAGTMISIVLTILMSIRFEFLTIKRFTLLLLFFMGYIFSVSSLFVMFSVTIKKVMTLQISGALLLIIFSVLGGNFLSMEFVNNPMVFMNYLIPNYWFVTGLTRMLIQDQFVILFINYMSPMFILGFSFIAVGYALQLFLEKHY